MAGVRKLGRGVVAPDDHVLDVLHGNAALPGNLSHGSVLEQENDLWLSIKDLPIKGLKPLELATIRQQSWYFRERCS